MQVKRTMLANLQIGEYIDYIVFVNGKPKHLQSQVTKIEIHDDFGRVWTTTGPLNWQMLTSKYQVVPPPIQNFHLNPARVKSSSVSSN